MRLTRRGKRRLLIVIALAAVPVIGVIGLVALRDVYRGQRVEEARARGLAAHTQGQYEQSLSDLVYALSRNPRDVECLLAFADSRARVFKANNRHLVDAAQSYHAILTIDPGNLTALEGLLDIYTRLGYRTEAEGIADRIIAGAADHQDAWSVKAAQAYHLQRFGEVESICTRMSELRPQEMLWRALHVRAMQARSAPQRAIVDLCDGWIAGHQKDGRFRLFKAQVLSDMGRRAEARQALIGASDLGADSQEVLELMVGLLDQFDMRSEADDLVARSKSRFAGYEWVFEAAIRRHWQAGRTALAMEELAEAQRHLGASTLGLVRWKALLCAATGKVAEAANAVEELLRIAEGGEPAKREVAKAWAEALKARLDIENSGWLAAAEALDRAIVLDPADSVLLFLLAEAFQRIGEHETALMILQRAQEQDANWLALQAARAESLLAVGNAAESFREYSSIVNRSPGDVTYLLRLTRTWLDLGDQGKGIRLRDAATGREYGLLDLLQQLHDSMGWNSHATAMLVEAECRFGSTLVAGGIVEQACQQPVDADNLLRLADVCRQWLPDREERVVLTAKQRAGLTPQVAIAQARLLHRRGELDPAVALLDEARTLTVPPWTDDLAWEAAWLLFQADRPGSVDRLLSQIASMRSANTIHALLSHLQTWRHETIVHAAVEQLKLLHGGRSPRTLMVEARAMLQFKASDAESNAQALKLTRSVLEVIPDSSAALGLMASLLMAGDHPQPAEAIAHLRRAAAAQPEDWGVYPFLIQLLQQQGEFDLAVKYLEAMELHANGRAARHRQLASLAEQLGEFDRALASLRSISDTARTEDDAVRIARLLVKSGQLEAAAEAFRLLLDAPEPSERALLASAEYYGSRQQVEAGLTALDRALAGRGAAFAALCRARLYARAGAFDRAQSELAKAVELEPGNALAWSDLARVQLALGALIDAGASALKAVKLAPEDEANRATLATIASLLRGPDQARLLAEVGQLVDAQPALERILKVRATAANPRQSDLADADQLVHDYPRMLAAWRVAIEVHAAAGQWEHAISMAKQAVLRFPADPGPAEMATRLLLEVGRPNDALAMAGAWRRLTLADPIEADFVMAALLLDLKRAADARAQLEPHANRVTHEQKLDADRLRVWLSCLLGDGQAERATAIVESLVKDESRWAAGLKVIGLLPPAQCRGVLATAEAMAPSGPEAALWLSLALRDVGIKLDDKTMLTRADQAARSAAEHPRLHSAATVIRAAIAAQLDDLASAEALYRETLARNPDDAGVLNNLAEILVLQGNQTACDEAVELATRALGKVNNDPAVLDTLAQALLCAGDYRGAEQRIAVALARQPGNPAFVVTLAALRQAQGRVGDARAELDHARTLAAGRNDAVLRRRIESLARRLEDLTVSR